MSGTKNASHDLLRLSSLTFRTATPQDAPQIQSLVQTSFRAADSRPAWTADMKLGSSFSVPVSDISSRIANPDSFILMATTTTTTSSPHDSNLNTKVVKVLVASIEVSYKPTTGSSARLSMLAVNPSYQQSGIGRHVLAYAETYCLQTWPDRIKKIGLNALSSRQELIKWYERRGYHRTGETTPFLSREKLVELGLEGEELYFVELEKDVNTQKVIG
ncbi:acyl-CoA N-acyltransferase [Diplogelasinospora grovesii]|uniref:Acyl-CoA N-acyltransferase n=1 Tax=Diplogelasinospora grovesii TaxID=303347 RepID=A0AAN6RYB3_9PEZI|nr:acyl-CoA N-acyltransferase [Diplogelasinospora grovesii]